MRLRDHTALIVDDEEGIREIVQEGPWPAGNAKGARLGQFGGCAGVVGGRTASKL